MPEIASAQLVEGPALAFDSSLDPERAAIAAVGRRLLDLSLRIRGCAGRRPAGWTRGASARTRCARQARRNPSHERRAISNLKSGPNRRTESPRRPAHVRPAFRAI